MKSSVSTGMKAMVILAVALLVIPPAPAAYAQSREPRTLLELLFGRPRRAEPQPPQDLRQPAPRAKTKARTTKRTNKSVTRITTAPKKTPSVEKLEDARKILVVGDFFAGALADGLKLAFADSPGVIIDESSKGSSGLVRDDYYDWQKALPALLEQEKPYLVVVAIGANDRQTITNRSGEVPFRTDAWLERYEQRVTSLANIVTEKRLPLLWMGLPSFTSSNMTADAITLNNIYRKAVTAAGGEFIDIWDGFVDVEGRFIVTGSDIKGQQVRLRGTDGIGMTEAGKRKMAFYAEKPIRRILGDMASPDLVRLDGSNLPELLNLPPSDIQNLVRTRPISISDPELDGADELLGGGKPMPPSPIPTPRDMLVQSGVMAQPPAGRVDDYRMKMPGLPNENGKP